MALIDAGLFILVIGIAFAMMIISFTMASVLRLIAMILFFIASLWMLAGDEVAYTATLHDGINPDQNSTKYIISNSGNSNNWLGWIFLMLGIFNGFLFFIELTRG